MTSADTPVDRGAFVLLEDSVVLAMRADTETDFENAASLARSSILASALFVESCANTCLDLLALDRAFANDVDRLPTLSKFDLFIRLHRPKRKIDRSRHEVQGFVELKQIRDSFVHPKTQRPIFDSLTEEESISRSPRTRATDLPRIASYCDVGDIPRAMVAAHSFLGYVFSDLAGFKPSHVSALLLSDESVPNHHEEHYPIWHTDRHLWLKAHKVSINYLRIGVL